MKVKLTPLNIVTALAFALLIVSFFEQKPTGMRQVDLTGFYKFILGSLVVVTFISDLIFRFSLKDLKKIWIVELVFIVLTIILILILQK